MRVENPGKNYRRIMVPVLLISLIASLSIIIVIANHLSERKEATSARGVWRYASVDADRVNGILYNIIHGYGYAPPCTPIPVRQFPSFGYTSTYAWTRQHIQVYINGQWVDDLPDIYVDVP
ncbi:MAG: hypothetical protein ACP5PQ_05670 [Thermoproteota archaeon]